jgi:hypothetical protein
MITKCQFCNYQKETPLSLIILEVASDNTLPEEDKILWIQRLVKVSGNADWSGVKIHMGMKHKDETYSGIWPECQWSEEEINVIKSGSL